MDIGELIKIKRKERGLTQEELGKMIGVKKSAVYKYEKGIIKNLKRSVLENLSNILEIDPAVLILGADDGISERIKVNRNAGDIYFMQGPVDGEVLDAEIAMYELAKYLKEHRNLFTKNDVEAMICFAQTLINRK